MTGLAISRITATNVLRYEEFTLDAPGKLTLYRGQNDTGKTTALRLLSLAFEGEPDPRRILHNDAKKAEIVIDFGVYKLRRSWTEKGQYVTVKDRDGGAPGPSPQAFLAGLMAGEVRFNPLAWLAMPPKEQTRLLLQAIDVRLTEEEYVAATGRPAPFSVNFERHGLLVLDDLRSEVSDERAGEKATADRKLKAAAELRKALPVLPPEITDERRAASSQALAKARNAIAALDARKLAAKEHVAAETRLHDAIAREQGEIDRLSGDIARLETEIVEIQQKIARRREQTHEAGARSSSLTAELTTLATSAPPTPQEINDATGRLVAAEAEQRAIAADEKVIGAFAEVEKWESEAGTAAITASILDAAIKTITGPLRQSLLAKAQLPVGALSIEGDRILVDGHDLSNVAESKQILIAVSIARALSPKLKVILLDGAERLDANTFATFLEVIRGDGYQYFAAEVDRGVAAMEIVRFVESEMGVVETTSVVEAVA